jgi:4-hydroxy-tetrahydrodipicolinate synthase
MNWEHRGILPAMQLPFEQDLSIDEVELRRFAKWLAGHKGIGGLVTNGHTGEVFALTAKQRAQATRVVADEVNGKLPVVSGICCEGIEEAVEQAQMANQAGASALLVMPPHQWLRFGMRQPDNVVDYFTAIGNGAGLDLVVHIYPAWTRASYAHLPRRISASYNGAGCRRRARRIWFLRSADDHRSLCGGMRG